MFARPMGAGEFSVQRLGSLRFVSQYSAASSNGTNNTTLLLESHGIRSLIGATRGRLDFLLASLAGLTNLNCNWKSPDFLRFEQEYTWILQI